MRAGLGGLYRIQVLVSPSPPLGNLALAGPSPPLGLAHLLSAEEAFPGSNLEVVY